MGVFAAPRSPHRLTGAPYIAFEVFFFGLATAALVVSAPASLAAAFGVVAAVNTVVLQRFGAR